MKTMAYIEDMLLQHRKIVEKAVKCEIHGNKTKATEHWEREAEIANEIVTAFHEQFSQLTYENLRLKIDYLRL